MLWQLEVIMESGYQLIKALDLISGTPVASSRETRPRRWLVNLRERLAIKNQRLDIFEK